MGQYYKPVTLDPDNNVQKWVWCYDFNNGAKLMEHSWLGNKFVAAFETLLCGDLPQRVVWAGDYADPEVNADGTERKYVDPDDGEEYTATLYSFASLLDPYRPEVDGLGEESHYQWKDENGEQLKEPIITFTRKEDVVANAHPLVVPTLESHPFLINWDKKQFVDKRKVPKDSDGWSIHPLPILTVEGNGRGGGDLHEEYISGNAKLIGVWARDHISVATTAPAALDWEEIDFDIVEVRS